MSEIKKLAGQTIWYGMSSVGARMLSYLLTPILTYIMSDAKGVADYGDYSTLYAFIAFLNVIFAYGFETGYFRFSNKEGVDADQLFQTTFGSLLISSILLFIGFGIFHQQINDFLELKDHPEYILWAFGIIALDAIAIIPFAKLRQLGRPKRYAFIKLGGIIINVLLAIFLLAYLPLYYESNPNGLGKTWFEAQNKIGLLLLANLIMNAFVVLMLLPEWKGFRFKINRQLWLQVFKYASPMIIIGLAGMVNEVVDRILLQKLLPTSPQVAKMIVGIYSANYKLAIFITLFIQAFKLAAEPFFFKKAQDKNSPQLYAKVMKWFVFTMCLAFLFTTLFIDLWQYIIDENYRSGLGIVWILLLANISLGIYYNLSVWYKLTDRMRAGIYITLLGAAVTIIGNVLFIPKYGMYGAAWSTFAAYTSMVFVSYIAGQKYYPVPYPISKIFGLITLMAVMYAAHKGIMLLFDTPEANIKTLIISISSGFVLFMVYMMIVLRWFKSDLQGIKYFSK